MLPYDSTYSCIVPTFVLLPKYLLIFKIQKGITENSNGTYKLDVLLYTRVIKLEAPLFLEKKTVSRLSSF
jgi:hypothetical protein